MASRKKKSSGGAFTVLAILAALIAVLLWEIGCSRQTQTGENTPPAPAVSRESTPRQHVSTPQREAPATTEEAPEKHIHKHEAEHPKQEEPAARRIAEESGSPAMAPDAEPGTPGSPAMESPAPPSEPAPAPVSAPEKRPVRSSNGRAQIYIQGGRGSHRVALTFDAGASAEPTAKILSTLAKYDLHVTFFLTGKWIQQNPAMARRIAQAGHEIGNHSYNHPRFVTLSDSQMVDQIRRTETLIRQTTGEDPRPMFRPPYGSYNKHVLEVLADNGYPAMIYWSLDSWDSVKPGITSAEIARRVLGKVKDGDIVLMHCGSQPTADALDEIIRTLQSRGYTIVSIRQLFRL